MSINPEMFFGVWKKSCLENETLINDNWDNKTERTKIMIGRHNPLSVLETCKKKINNYESSKQYELHGEYYQADAVFYDSNNRVYPKPRQFGKITTCDKNAVWLREILVHLEHENNVKTSWQELTQLLVLPGIELNVLISYSEKEEQEIDFLNGYLEILNEVSVKEKYYEKLLIIYGCKENNQIFWHGYKYSDNKFKFIGEE